MIFYIRIELKRDFKTIFSLRPNKRENKNCYQDGNNIPDDFFYSNKVKEKSKRNFNFHEKVKIRGRGNRFDL